MSRVSLALRRRVRLRARSLCEYCRSLMDYTGHEFTVDHIVPESLGGANEVDNLCHCCFWCNSHKQTRTAGRDPRTGGIVPLFNPRRDRWRDHFRWSRTLTRVVGRTASGRATVNVIHLNRPSLVRARKVWVRHGLHPADDQ